MRRDVGKPRRGGGGQRGHDNAITQYTVALVINPTPPLAGSLFVKCSEAWAALCLWEGALKHADEVRVPAAVVVLLLNSATRVD